MAYKIHYQSRKRRKGSQTRVRIAILTCGFFVLFALAAWLLLPSELDALRQALFREQEVESLLLELRGGESIADAVAAFCQEIVDGK